MVASAKDRHPTVGVVLLGCLILGANSLQELDHATEAAQIQSPEMVSSPGVDHARLEEGSLPQPEFEDDRNMTDFDDSQLMEEDGTPYTPDMIEEESSQMNLFEEELDDFIESIPDDDYLEDGGNPEDFPQNFPETNIIEPALIEEGGGGEEEEEDKEENEEEDDVSEEELGSVPQPEEGDGDMLVKDGGDANAEATMSTPSFMIQDDSMRTSRGRRRRRRRRSSAASYGPGKSTPAEWKALQDAVKATRQEFQQIKTTVVDKMSKMLKALDGIPSGPSPSPSPSPGPTPSGGGSIYTYIWLVPTKLRSGSIVQLSEVKFKASGKDVKPQSAENAPGGRSPGHEGPPKAIDGNTRSKWLAFNKNGIIFKFGTKVSVDAFTYVTANDVQNRDLVQFELKGSNDKSNWNTIFRKTTDMNVPSARLKEVPWCPLEPMRKEGNSCDEDMQCETSLCKNGRCSKKSGEGSSCFRKEDCSTGVCENRRCVKPSGVLLMGKHIRKCIDHSGGGSLSFSTCNANSASQLWSKRGDGQFENAKTGKCIIQGGYKC